MARLSVQLRTAGSLLRGGQFAFLAERLRMALWSERRHITFCRDLAADRDPGAPAMRFTVRPFAPGDMSMLDGEPISDMDAMIRTERRHWIEAGLPGCHVATVRDNEPCFMQWLLGPSDNEQIRSFFGDTLPQLESGTVLLEGAYTPPRYRRLPIMPSAMARIAEIGRQWGATRAIVSTAEENASMVKAVQLAGFVPNGIQVERRRLFRRSITHKSDSSS